jgi:F0F1-type ATP synthase assembly protein I
MTEKFTLRDILVYTLLGLIVLFFSYLHHPFEISSTVKDLKDYSDLTVLLLVPFSYLLGHILMSLDDIIFNGVLLRFFPEDNPLKNGYWKFYNFLFFGYRNIGIRNKEKITNKEFLETCDKLIAENKYEKAEYYQVMSDLFKGIFLIIFLSIVIDTCNRSFELWKFILIFLIWYRAKMFSAYYVRMVKRNK